MGGKAANVVLDDAPLDQAVEGIVNGIFFNQGHVCTRPSRRSPTSSSPSPISPHAIRGAPPPAPPTLSPRATRHRLRRWLGGGRSLIDRAAEPSTEPARLQGPSLAPLGRSTSPCIRPEPAFPLRVPDRRENDREGTVHARVGRRNGATGQRGNGATGQRGNGATGQRGNGATGAERNSTA
ncbi:aldehyde dehydrogenase family protein [Actinopolymorpha cephalotaxi]|uniref:aldehyde dehydrogenase family protein n=1 Tax=Actinopolymorpha cephalotaxi TaxID=504797 RepID=UPI001EDA265D|nr:aldehyde dehydrogenase family protein [Actinopolymorpha cephalotaxi]